MIRTNLIFVKTTYCPLIEYCAGLDTRILGSKHDFEPSSDIVEEVGFGNGDASPWIRDYEVFICGRGVSLVLDCFQSCT
jgi:hypothetical protein